MGQQSTAQCNCGNVHGSFGPQLESACGDVGAYCGAGGITCQNANAVYDLQAGAKHREGHKGTYARTHTHAHVAHAHLTQILCGPDAKTVMHVCNRRRAGM